MGGKGRIRECAAAGGVSPRRLGSFIALLLLGGLFVFFAHGETAPRFEMKATAGFGGVYKLNCWTPLRITISNPDHFTGPVTVRADLEAGCPSSPHGRVVRRFRTNLELDGSPETQLVMGFRPSYTNNKCWLYLLDRRPEAAGGMAPKQAANTACATGQCPMIRPGDLPQSERILHAVSLKEVVSAGKRPYQPFYTVAAPSSSLEEILNVRNLLQNRGECNSSVAKATELVEDPSLYETVDAVVLDQVADASLTTAHAVALRDWVLGGGTLVLTRTCLESPWGAELLRQFPVKARITGPAAAMDWGAAAAFFGAEPGSVNNIEVLPLALDPSFTAIRANGMPLLARHRFTQGNLVLVPFHTADLRGATGPERRLQERVWSRALEGVMQRSGNYWDIQATVPGGITIRRLAFPYLLFVVVSALCLGPLCTLLVRARNRRIHVLWLLPAISVLLCTAAFAAAMFFRGGASHVENVTILQGDANGNSALVRDYVGMMSGTSGTYAFGPLPPHTSVLEEIEGDGNRELAMVGLFPPVVDMGSDGIGVNDLHMNRWTMRFFNIGRPGEMPPLSGNLQLVSNRVTGWVRNDSEQAIDKAALLFKWNRQSLGSLAPGQRVEINLPLAPPPETVRVFNPYYANFDQVSYPLNPAHWPDTPFNPGVTRLLGDCQVLTSPTVVGLLPDRAASSTPVQLGGQPNSRKGMAIGVWHLPVEASLQGTTVLSPEISVAKSTYNGQWMSCIYARQWPETLEIEFPAMGAVFNRPEITLHTRLTGKSAKAITPQDEIRVRFFDWTAQALAQETKITVGDMAIPNSARFVRPGDNKIVLSITLSGPKADKYESLELDRMECSVREAAP